MSDADLIKRLRGGTMRFDWSDLPDDALIPAVPLLREAADTLAEMRKALDEATRPNLFWDDDNPEESFTSIEDLVDYIGVHQLVIKVRIAKSLPDTWVSAALGEDGTMAIAFHHNHDDAFAEMNRASALARTSLLDGEDDR